MSAIFSWIQSNYQYLIYAVEFVGVLTSFIFAIVFDVKCKRSSALNDSNLARFNDLHREYLAISHLPEWISVANTLYPVHGDGFKRFNYVYAKFLESLNEKPSDFLFFEVKGLIDKILSADSGEKIFLKEESQDEEIQSVQAERSEYLPQNCSKEQGSKYRTVTISRRN